MDKNNVMMIVIIALLVILIGTIGFMSVYLISFFGEPEEAVEIVIDGERQVPQDQLITVVYDDAIRGLIPDGRDSHAITFRLSVAIDNSSEEKDTIKQVDELSTLLYEREQVVKSLASEIIYNYSHADYDGNPDIMKATLAQEIAERLSFEFGTNLIYRVYISDYLYQ